MLFEDMNVDAEKKRGFGVAAVKEKTVEKNYRKELELARAKSGFFSSFLTQNVPPEKSTPSMGVIGMLAKPANGEFPPLPKGERDEDGQAAAAAALEAATAAAAAAPAPNKTTPWSGDPDEVHFTGARDCCCCC